MSPLYGACYEGHESTVQLLLNNGADTEADPAMQKKKGVWFQKMKINTKTIAVFVEKQDFMDIFQGK